MDKYTCTQCGHTYNPEIGDPDSDILPDTPFEELPEDWCCSYCEAAKENFEED